MDHRRGSQLVRSSWVSQIKAIMNFDIRDEKTLIELLKNFNEKICVVEIDIAVPKKHNK